MAGPIQAQDVFQSRGFLPGIQTIPLPTITLAANTRQFIDMTFVSLQNQTQTLQAIWIDNSTNNGIVYAYAKGTVQFVVCPAFSCGWFPLVINPILGVDLLWRPLIAGTPTGKVNICLSSAPFSQGPFLCIGATDGFKARRVNASGNTNIVPALPNHRLILQSLSVMFSAYSTAGISANMTVQDLVGLVIVDADISDAVLGRSIVYSGQPNAIFAINQGIDVNLSAPVAPHNVEITATYSYVAGEL